MENKVGVGANLKSADTKKSGVVAVLKKKVFERREPYLLPCGNEKEYCFMQVRRKNTRFCATWKRIIWGKCRHHVETPHCRWEER